MKLVIVEDRPWKMEESIRLMQNMGLTVERMLYVYVDEESPAAGERLSGLEESLGIEIRAVKRSEFQAVMNEYYPDLETLFFCDLNLSGDHREFFQDRVNVIFAKEIMKKEGGRLNRIWFYTTAGEATNEQINTNFPGRNLAVESVKEGQVILDKEDIEKAVEAFKAARA